MSFRHGPILGRWERHEAYTAHVVPNDQLPFRALILYLERPEQVGRTQRSEKYCKTVSRWTSCTWNGESPLTFELPMGFSVAKAGAGAKNGDFWRGIRDYF